MKHVSASQITTFRDCPRKWYFEKVAGLTRPGTSATELGSAVHSVLEAYLRGEVATIEPLDEVRAIARSGLEHLPTPHAGLEIELSLADDMPLTDSPVPVLGYVDLIDHARNEIIDHKTSSSPRYTKTESELRQNVQLHLYARAYFERFPERDKVTLTHVYYGTKTRWSKRVSVVVTREENAAQWAQIKDTISQMLQVSASPNAGAVPACYDECDKYGGCPFKGACVRAASYTPKTLETKTKTDKETNMSNMNEQQRLAALTGGARPSYLPTNAAAPTPEAPKRPAAKVLYIGCMPLKGASNAPVMVVDAYADLVREICAAFHVPHMGLVDFGKGWAALVGGVADRGWPADVAALYLDPLSKEYEHLVSVLVSLADVVVKRA